MNDEARGTDYYDVTSAGVNGVPFDRSIHLTRRSGVDDFTCGFRRSMRVL